MTADTLQPLAGGGRDSALPGARLAEAREAQNLTAADVARQLKLSVWQVEALEAGRYQRLPGPIFVRGFIRNYARIVKLDPEELLRAAGDSLPQRAERQETPPSHDIPFPGGQAPRWPRYAMVAVVIFGALAVYEFAWNEPRSTMPPQVVATAVPAAPRETPPAPAPVPVAEAAPDMQSVQPEAVAIPVSTDVARAAQPDPQPVAAPAIAERVSRNGEKQVRLDFDQESWVEIRDRNERVIFSQLNHPGTSRQVIGLPPFSIVVGNAHGVRMTYGDQPVDLASHTKIDVARLILP